MLSDKILSKTKTFITIFEQITNKKNSYIDNKN